MLFLCFYTAVDNQNISFCSYVQSQPTNQHPFPSSSLCPQMTAKYLEKVTSPQLRGNQHGNPILLAAGSGHVTQF